MIRDITHWEYIKKKGEPKDAEIAHLEIRGSLHLEQFTMSHPNWELIAYSRLWLIERYFCCMIESIEFFKFQWLEARTQKRTCSYN